MPHTFSRRVPLFQPSGRARPQRRRSLARDSIRVSPPGDSVAIPRPPGGRRSPGWPGPIIRSSVPPGSPQPLPPGPTVPPGGPMPAPQMPTVQQALAQFQSSRGQGGIRGIFLAAQRETRRRRKEPRRGITPQPTMPGLTLPITRSIF